MAPSLSTHGHGLATSVLLTHDRTHSLGLRPRDHRRRRNRARHLVPLPGTRRAARRPRPAHRPGRARSAHRRTTSAATCTSTSSPSRSTWMPPPHPPRTPTCACTCSATCSCSRTPSTSTASSRHLPIVAWTNAGPDAPRATSPRLRPPLQRAGISAHGIDKFPRLLDYVMPDRVRIADASRVRLGAHLAPGTTVMHEGFVNFNAGTLGASMVEGRISQGVVVGDGSDIGGGASIMGTLSRRRHAARRDRRARAARRELRHRHLDRRRLRRRGRAST